MNFGIEIFLSIVGCALVAWLILTFFSNQARVERRRRRNNERVINRAGRPTVKFSVKNKN